MKRSILSLLMCSILWVSIPIHAENSLPKVAAKGATLIEQESGRVLFEKNGEQPLAMASTTKIMTCILAIEKGDLQDIVVTSKRAKSAPPVKLNLKVGEKQYLGDLLYALMLQSDNDVAVAIAEHIGGNVEHFCEMMTQKAHEIGAIYTYFKTPNGLDAEGHVSTAHDMALIGAYAMKNPEFVKIVGTTTLSIPTQGIEGSCVHDLQCKNRFIYSYQGAKGIKTGFTNKAGHCFVGAAEKNGMTLIGAALGSGWGNKGKTQKYTDVIHMMDYGFNNYQMYTLIEPKKDIARLPIKKAILQEVPINCKAYVKLPLTIKEKDDIYIKTILPTELVAPIKEEEQVGEIQVICQGALLAQVPLYPDTSISKASVLDYIKNWLNK